ncbi:rubredoxin [Candidatus Magnetominusculus xianensis]|nr:rubredoxin [Nitrospirota bacterium]
MCRGCGYIYDPAHGDKSAGVPEWTSFNDLPSGWRCPLCSVGKSEFIPW